MEMRLSLSALTPSQYRKYVKGWDKKRYADLFAKYNGDRNAYRIYIPLQKGNVGQLKYANAPKAVVEALNAKGYNVDDYIAGTAVDSSGKRRVRMGKLLPPELQQVVANDPVRQGAKAASSGDQVIVISRHPYDVAGMSTDRGWVSCMNLISGSNKHYVEADVRDGSIIAYLTHKNDLNIKNPSARVLLRVYTSEEGKTGLFPSGIYGNGGPSFINTLKRWCSEVNSSYFHIPFGATMRMLTSMYSDAGAPAELRHYEHDADKDLEVLRAQLGEDPSDFAALYESYADRYTTAEDRATVFDMVLHSGNKEWIDKAALPALNWLSSAFAGPYSTNNTQAIRALTQVGKSAARIVVAAASRHPPVDLKNAAQFLPCFVLMSDAWQERAALSYEEAQVVERYIQVSEARVLAVFTHLLRYMPTPSMFDAYPKGNVSDAGAARSLLGNPLWYKTPYVGTRIEKAVKKHVADDKKRNPEDYEVTRDGVPTPTAQLAPVSKLPALFKAHMSGLTVNANQYQDSYWQDSMQVLMDRMPDEKWPTAMRGSPNPMSLFAADAQYQMSVAGQQALGKVVANYIKFGSTQGRYQIVLPYVDSHMGNGLVTRELLAQIDPKNAIRAVGSAYLSRMMGGADGDRELRIDMSVENYIASNPLLYVGCCDFTYTNTDTSVRYCAAWSKVPYKDRHKFVSSVYELRRTAGRAAQRILDQIPMYAYASWMADYVEDAHPVDVERSWHTPELRTALDTLVKIGRDLNP